MHSVAHDTAETNSAANWLLSLDPLLGERDPLECGLAHRLDFATSGIMVAAREELALEHLKRRFRERKLDKIYSLLCASPPPQPGVYEAYAETGSKSAKRVRVDAHKTGSKKQETLVTEILSIHPENGVWRVTVKLVTGYRHQIRAHLAALGCPVLGDTTYGGAPAPRLMLHAQRIAFLDARGNFREAESAVPF